MPGSTARIPITERQQPVLQQVVAARTSSVRWAQRANVIGRAFAGEENRALAAAIDLDATAVGLWRRRRAKAWPKVIPMECTETQAACRRAIEDVLSDALGGATPASSRPSRSRKVWPWPASRRSDRHGRSPGLSSQIAVHDLAVQA